MAAKKERMGHSGTTKKSKGSMTSHMKNHVNKKDVPTVKASSSDHMSGIHKHKNVGAKKLKQHAK